MLRGGRRVAALLLLRRNRRAAGGGAGRPGPEPGAAPGPEPGAAPGPAAGPPEPPALPFLVCPLSKRPLRYEAAAQELVNEELGIAYPVVDGIPTMLPEAARKVPARPAERR